jgi:DNA-3-methyladenine glycosylase
MILKKDFYDGSSLDVAKQLLGCFLVRKSGNKIWRTKIVETEAYEGPKDLASHASRGKTPRNAVMFEDAGVFYVYFTYGMHHMLNVVTGKKEHPAAVLIRAVEPISGFKNPPSLGATARRSGPARLTRSLQIDKRLNALPAYVKKYGLWIEVGEKIKKSQIVAAKRIGVDYAKEYKDKLWRFYIKDNPFVSKK